MKTRSLIVRPDWPFNIKRVPFFYGWVIWALSTLGIVMSVPGQTMGMAVFTDTFIEALGLTRTQLAIAYFFGTLMSALLLTRAGRIYDRVGARTMIVGASVILALVILYISVVDRLALAIAGPLGLALVWISFPLILIGYFGVRLTGQGVLTSASRNVLLVWFDKRRGFIVGLRGVFVSFSFSLAPLVIAAMILAFGWRGALWAMALVTGLGFAGLALIFLRDNPEQCGTVPDGVPHTEGEHSQPTIAEDKTIHDARRSPVFWIYAGGLSLHGMFGTAVTFHVVSIFEEMGRTATEAFAYFLPQAVVSVSVNLTASTLSDKRPLKPFLIAMLMFFMMGALGLLILDQMLGYWMLVVGMGGGGGLWAMNSNIAFIRFFGRASLGEISGFNAALVVFGSAVGPLLFAYMRDQSGSYQAAVLVSLGLVVALLIGAVAIRQDDPLRRA